MGWLIEAASRPSRKNRSRASGESSRVTQDLERHPASAFQVLGFINRPHAARAQRPDDGVMAKLLARLRQAAGLRSRRGHHHRALGTGAGLSLHRELEEAFRAQVGRRVTGQLSAAPHAPALPRGRIVEVCHIVPPYA